MMEPITHERDTKHDKTFEPFYFMSYDRVVAVVADLRELNEKMPTLVRQDRPCVEYHLAQGHLVNWLEYINEPDLARDLSGVSDAKEALLVVEKHVVRSVAFHGMNHGRKR